MLVCRKCYRTIETIIKTDEKNNDAKQKIKDSVDRVYRTQILSLPSPRRKIITKRLLRSPENVSRPAKSLATVAYVSPVKLSWGIKVSNNSARVLYILLRLGRKTYQDDQMLTFIMQVEKSLPQLYYRRTKVSTRHLWITVLIQTR